LFVDDLLLKALLLQKSANPDLPFSDKVVDSVIYELAAGPEPSSDSAVEQNREPTMNVFRDRETDLDKMMDDAERAEAEAEAEDGVEKDDLDNFISDDEEHQSGDSGDQREIEENGRLQYFDKDQYLDLLITALTDLELLDAVHPQACYFFQNLRRTESYAEAWGYFEDLLRYGYIPNGRVITEIFKLCCDAGWYLKAHQLMNQMYDSDQVTIDALQTFLKNLLHFQGVKASNLDSRIAEVVDYMKHVDRTYEADIDVFNSILKLYLCVDYWQKAFLVYRDLTLGKAKKKGKCLEPNEDTFSLLMSYFWRNDMSEQLKTLVDVPKVRELAKTSLDPIFRKCVESEHLRQQQQQQKDSI